MEISLKPQEYYYLYSPMRAVPEEMLKYTIQSLVLEGHISAYYKFIYINPNEKRKRKRLFFKLGTKYDPSLNYSRAEKLLLSLLKKDDEIRVYELKNRVLEKLDNNIGNFMYDYVYEDVNLKKLCRLKYFLTGKGRDLKRRYAALIDYLDINIDKLLTQHELLQNNLKELETGIIFLEKRTLEKLSLKVPDLDEVAAAFEIITGGTTYSSFGRGGSFYGGGGYYGGGGGTSWGGFGGGMGGGAGSGGSW